MILLLIGWRDTRALKHLKKARNAFENMTLKSRFFRACNIDGEIIDKKATLGIGPDTMTNRAEYFGIRLCERQIGRDI